MSGEVCSTESVYIGWDVGAWNCDRNPESRDAVAILDSGLRIIGNPWRGNLRESINEAASTRDFLSKLFKLCESSLPNKGQVVLAIDTPLGVSKEFIELVSNLRAVEKVQAHSRNPYLFRHTERLLFERGYSPLSPVLHMIGCQSTKGMHVLAKFARTMQKCGVWTDGDTLRIIEAYPSACGHSEVLQKLRSRCKHVALGHSDKEDALTCALIAYLFAEHQDSLSSPTSEIPESEGWIWVPADAKSREAAL
jgi:predicted nuclease with RNAse H fold